ncbi:zinc-dependent alcohol dehydrogenase [Microcella sp.]|uniref:zinc-dependent alcohol dehydrogenase n=1 Tax=Microcella sp. TaxID=1913979 RepID=UPI002564F182|nr:alcohol dehydrogenase catalytic domain-containing protein [Microcella sp.]MBX9471690.1 alcohol dehydrogenase catalytic domain-containing protein [Microcella sp.]
MSEPTTMTAVVKVALGADNVLVQQVAVPVAPPGFARVRVAATGICGTDIHVAHDEYAFEAPVIMGHEILGVVDSVGDPADAAAVGQRVACETYYSSCGTCQWCRAGRRNLCPRRRSLGSFENGGFARYVVMPMVNLHPLPDVLGELDGVLAEPLACVAQCLLDPAIVNAGDRVLVTGPGAMGQLAAQVARSQGGHVTIAGLEKDADRLAVAASLGIETTTLTPEEESFDVVIECSGSAPGAATALRAAKRGAKYVQVGIFGRDISLPFDLVLYKELAVSSGFASTATSWGRAIALIEQGLVTLGPLVTRRVSIDDFSIAFASAASGEGIKTVVIPS